MENLARIALDISRDGHSMIRGEFLPLILSSDIEDGDTEVAIGSAEGLCYKRFARAKRLAYKHGDSRP